MEISLATFAYPEIDGNGRARVAAPAGGGLPAGTFVLSTCLRVELLAAGARDLLEASLSGSTTDGVVPRWQTGEDAAVHIFRVAAGLESPILGEIEVLTQFRQAIAELRERGTAPRGLLKLLESAVAAGRAAREAMGTSPHDTMAALAAQVVGPSSRVAVIGSGTMARAVVAALSALPAPPAIAVLARSPDLVNVEGVMVQPLEELTAVLAEFPAVVSATAASGCLMSPEDLAASLVGREEPLVMVDMAMPPDFAPPEEGSFRYIGIDQLAGMARRRLELPEVSKMVATAAREAFHSYANHDRAAPVIRSMFALAENAVDETVDRFSGRLADPADRDILRQAVHTVARKLMDRPVTAVRSSRDPALVEVFADIYEDA